MAQTWARNGHVPINHRLRVVKSCSVTEAKNSIRPLRVEYSLRDALLWLRVGELFAIRWGSVDLKGRRLRVASQQKGSSPPNLETGTRLRWVGKSVVAEDYRGLASRRGPHFRAWDAAQRTSSRAIEALRAIFSGRLSERVPSRNVSVIRRPSGRSVGKWG
jgi:hypothetical protein